MTISASSLSLYIFEFVMKGFDSFEKRDGRHVHVTTNPAGQTSE